MSSYTKEHTLLYKKSKIKILKTSLLLGIVWNHSLICKHTLIQTNLQLQNIPSFDLPSKLILFLSQSYEWHTLRISQIFLLLKMLLIKFAFPFIIFHFYLSVSSKVNKSSLFVFPKWHALALFNLLTLKTSFVNNNNLSLLVLF